MIEIDLLYYLLYQIAIIISNYQEICKSLKLLTFIRFKNFAINIIFQEQFETLRCKKIIFL
jgi:hypothetical protein